MLAPFKTSNPNIIEIGVDEAGRGPMFGPVFAAAVILPRCDTFDYASLKDSKRFHSKKKIKDVAEYIKKNALAYGIASCSNHDIDEINIRNATHRAMHNAIKQAIASLQTNKHITDSRMHLLIDGCDFKPYTKIDNAVIKQIPHTCITKGDNTIGSIAAASILAKTARDEDIKQLCETYPMINDMYGISTNNGYGTAAHLKGIATHGITQFHRKTFGACREAKLSHLN